MNDDITTIGIPSQLQAAMPRLPTLVTDAGERATLRFLEFFTAAIRNKNTRRAYGRAITRLSDWCQSRRLTLEQLHPIVIGGYIEQLQTELSAPSVKQHLAAIRMLFDFLVVGQILPVNPASSVRGPKYSSKKGKTPVLTAVETRELLESIESGRRTTKRLCRDECTHSGCDARAGPLDQAAPHIVRTRRTARLSPLAPLPAMFFRSQ